MEDINQEIGITEVRTEFHEFKRTTNNRLKELIENMKPQFTSAQITTFLLSLVIAVAGMMIYITDIKSDSRNNSTKINGLEKVDQSLILVDVQREKEYDAIMIMLTEIRKDLEAIKEKESKK